MNRLLSLILFCTITIPFTTQVYANKGDDSPVDNKSTYRLSDNIELISKSDVRYDKPRVVIRLAYPKLASTTDDMAPNPVAVDDPAENDQSMETNINTAETFNTETSRIIQDEIQLFKQKVAESASNQPKPRNRLTIDYSSAIVNLENEPIISIRFIIQGYIAGIKQPYRRYRTLNFDMESSSVLQLSDLFKPDSAYLAAISHYANKELARDEHGKWASNRNDDIPQEQLNNWNINLNGLRITFDEASVAPAELGSQTILIPYKKLSAFINKDSALGKCLEHRKSCMRDHLLTGGFIDEAVNTRHRRLNPAFG